MAVSAQIAPPRKRRRSRPSDLSHAQVEEIHRSRILAAVADAVGELDYSRITVGVIIARARMSRKTFYDAFSDREDCFLALFEKIVADASVLAREGYARGARGTSWREGVRLALAELLQLAEDEPGLARLCVVDTLVAGDRIRARRTAVLAELARAIDRGRLPGSPSGELPHTTAEGVVGAIVYVLHNRLLRGEEKPLTDLLGALMSIIVLPYLGPRAARRELERPDPPVLGRATPSKPARDPLQGLNIRLTYRTVRVLMAIAEHPGASNREVAENSGIIDQGQISKLMTRLERLELVENRGLGQEKGASNAWHLTPNGAHVERATRPR